MRIWVAVALLVCSLSAPAMAGDKAVAEAAFQQGKDLMKAGKINEACDAFEKSQANDPELGTEYNLATCYQKAGRLASAWAAFRELAQRDTNAARKADSEKQAASLQPRLIKLLISVRSPVAGLKVTRNGEDVSQSVGIESPVDPGDYEIGAVADGYKAWSVKVSAKQEGGTVQVTVPELERLPASVTPPTGDGMKPLPPGPGGHGPVATTTSSGGRKKLGLFIGGGGVVVAAAGLVFGGLASSKWSDVKKLCGDPSNCTATGTNLMTANSDASSAKTYGNVSTGLVVVGGAAIVTGVVLFLLSPSGEHAPSGEAFHVTPTVTSDGFALTAVGTF